MATTFLTLVNGVPRSDTPSGGGGTTLTVYESNLTIVSGAPVDSTQMTGPVTAGSNVTLPSGQTYSSLDLEVYLGGQRLDPVLDYAYVGSGARTQIIFTFGLVVGDVITFRINGSSVGVANQVDISNAIIFG